MKVAQSCLTFCDPTDNSVHGILQARILEWVAFPFSRGVFKNDTLNISLSHKAGEYLQNEFKSLESLKSI